MINLKKLGIIVSVLCLSQVIFLSSARQMLVINNVVGNNSKTVPLKIGCKKITNTCTFPIGIPLYPSGATKSFFLNKPACAVVDDCASIPVGCTAQTVNGYDISASEHAEILFVSKTVSGTPSNGLTTYSANATCNNGTYIISNESPIISCNAGYRVSGGTCINTCALPWGGTITNGQSVTAYDKSSGTCPSNNCASQTRTCNGTLGTLNGSYSYQTCTNNTSSQACSIANGIGSQSCSAGSASRGACTVTSCNAGYRVSGNTCINTCTLPWGGTITNGQSVTAYDKSSGTCPSNNCASQTRTCNGSLGTLNGSYAYSSCTNNTNTQSCSITNGVGIQACSLGSTSWGVCSLVTCNAGYTNVGGNCVAATLTRTVPCIGSFSPMMYKVPGSSSTYTQTSTNGGSTRTPQIERTYGGPSTNACSFICSQEVASMGDFYAGYPDYYGNTYPQYNGGPRGGCDCQGWDPQSETCGGGTQPDPDPVSPECGWGTCNVGTISNFRCGSDQFGSWAHFKCTNAGITIDCSSSDGMDRCSQRGY